MHSHTPVTITDIARAANVSVSTVSRILNQRGGKIQISQATQDRVLTVAQQLGYSPNPLALALRTQRTHVLGVIIRDIDDPFLSLLVRKLQQAAHQAGFEVLLGHAEHDFAVAQRQLQVMLTHLFDGLFLLGNVPGDDALLAALQQRHTPFVLVACGNDVQAPFVTVDDAHGTELALNYLYSLGHRRIAFLGDVVHAGVDARLTHYSQFLQDHDLPIDPAYIQLCPSKRGAAALQVQHLLDLPEPPTALFCGADLVALGAVNGVWQRGLRVPEDLSIIGFDDIEEAHETFPALTTIRQPVETMAQQSIALLRFLIEGSIVDEMSFAVVTPPELIIRSTCAPLSTE